MEPLLLLHGASRTDASADLAILRTEAKEYMSSHLSLSAFDSTLLICDALVGACGRRIYV
jgi:hypothetical protein